jgi:CHAD domain-containing protein
MLPKMENAGHHQLIRFLDEQVEALRQLLPMVVEDFSSTAIHQSRVATRRLKAGLDVFAPFVDSKRFRVFARFARRLRRRLAPLRDLDVMRGHLKEVASTPAARKGVDVLRKQFAQHQTKLRGKLLHEVDDVYLMEELGGWWAVRQQIADVVEPARSRVAEQVHELIDEFRRDARLVCKLEESDEPVDAHELRIVGKSLRYTLEMAIRVGHPVPADVMKLFKAMQDDLGLWHDFAVLAQHIVDQSSKSQIALHDASAQIALLEVAKVALKKSDASLAKFRTKWKSKGESIVPRLHQAIPLSVAVVETKESKTGLDPESKSEQEDLESLDSASDSAPSTTPAPSSNAARKRPSRPKRPRATRRDDAAPQ